MGAGASQAEKVELQRMIVNLQREQREGKHPCVARALALRAMAILGHERWSFVVCSVRCCAELPAAKRHAMAGVNGLPSARGPPLPTGEPVLCALVEDHVEPGSPRSVVMMIEYHPRR